MAESEIQTKVIASSGDVILLAGNCKKIKLRVESATLKRTSLVFTALLSPKYLEGQEVGTSASPKEIKLPEDDIAAMSNMCDLLHGNKATDGESPLSSDDILKLSVVIDKYACAEALHYQAQAILLWTLDKMKVGTMSAMAQLVAASYLMQQPFAFEIATRRLAKCTYEDYGLLLEETCAKLLPLSIFFAVERKRTMAYNKISAELPLLGTPVCALDHDGCGTKHGSTSINYDPGYMDELCTAFEIIFWPPDFRKMKYTVLDAIKRIRLIGTGRHDEPTCEHTSQKRAVTAQKFKDFVDEVADCCGGICLYCAREGKADLCTVCSDETHKQNGFE